MGNTEKNTGNKTAEKKNIIPASWQAKINEWKASCKVKAITVDDAGKVKFLFFKLPTRAELSAAENMAVDPETGQVDLYKKAEKMMVDCFLDGDLTLEQVMDNVELFMPVAKAVLYELVQEKKTSLISC